MEEKNITLKEIRQEARELKQLDGCYNDLPIKEIITDLKEAYQQDGYKIVKLKSPE